MVSHKSGFGGFEAIGTEAEQHPLILEDLMSYDEIQIAALIGLSGPTFFINTGSRGSLFSRLSHVSLLRERNKFKGGLGGTVCILAFFCTFCYVHFTIKRKFTINSVF